ncbi:UNVERIFIED_CONTAM: hypothetical protein PYX00_009526 [Menopon gallinae]|uniref:Uncharacterized protein n=1 Tax=Menopon gallinae TaxID=328185 RepID=A0AAW2HC45_9NEOP
MGGRLTGSLFAVLPKTLSSFGGVQYVPSQTTQPVQYYYQPQTQTAASTAATGSSLLYTSPQQYIPSYQYLTGNKLGAYQQQYVPTAPQTFSTAYTSSSPDYSAAYPAQTTTYSTSSVYPQSDQPTFVSLKAPQHLVASPGQQQQYLQSQIQTPSTTISPFKYLNSPQYLAQNYNTIQSSHLLPKNSLSSGIKSTVSPPLKFPGNTGYVTPSSSSGSTNYHTYRGIAG